MKKFDSFNRSVDMDGLMKDLREVEQNPDAHSYVEVPSGEYEVEIVSMELGISNTDKNGKIRNPEKPQNPMFKCQFKIIEGQYKDKMIFMNQVVVQAFQIHIVNEFLKSLDSGVTVEFTGDYNEYNDLILDIAEEIEQANLQYLLAYGETKKGFKTFEIEEVYEA